MSLSAYKDACDAALDEMSAAQTELFAAAAITLIAVDRGDAEAFKVAVENQRRAVARMRDAARAVAALRGRLESVPGKKSPGGGPLS